MARPLKYKNKEELQAAIDKYFESCNGTMLTDNDNNPVLNKYGEAVFINQKPPTVTGLALALGFNSRQALLNYQARKELAGTRGGNPFVTFPPLGAPLIRA